MEEDDKQANAHSCSKWKLQSMSTMFKTKYIIRDIQVNEVTCHTILIKNVDNTKGFGTREIILYLLPYDDTVSIILATYKACKGMELCGMTLQDVRTPVKPWPHHHLRQSSRLVLHNVHCPNQQQSIDEEKNKLVREEEVPQSHPRGERTKEGNKRGEHAAKD